MPHNRFELPDQFTLANDPLGGRGPKFVSLPGDDKPPRARKTRDIVSPADFLLAANENRAEGEEEFTRENLPEGYSIRRGGTGRTAGRGSETVLGVSYARPRTEHPLNPPTAPTPANSAEELDAAAEEQRKRSSKERGRASTILTGGQGLMAGSASAGGLNIRTLLGA